MAGFQRWFSVNIFMKNCSEMKPSLIRHFNFGDKRVEKPPDSFGCVKVLAYLADAAF
jgi:hypothetical protein